MRYLLCLILMVLYLHSCGQDTDMPVRAYPMPSFLIPMSKKLDRIDSMVTAMYKAYNWPGRIVDYSMQGPIDGMKTWSAQKQELVLKSLAYPGPDTSSHSSEAKKAMDWIDSLNKAKEIRHSKTLYTVDYDHAYDVKTDTFPDIDLKMEDGKPAFFLHSGEITDTYLDTTAAGSAWKLRSDTTIYFKGDNNCEHHWVEKGEVWMSDRVIICTKCLRHLRIREILERIPTPYDKAKARLDSLQKKKKNGK